jgi:hypothetical protein
MMASAAEGQEGEAAPKPQPEERNEESTTAATATAMEVEVESPHPFQAREERYDELCRSLNLDEQTRKIGWALLRRLTLKAGQQDEARPLSRTLFVFGLAILSRSTHARSPLRPGKRP